MADIHYYISVLRITVLSAIRTAEESSVPNWRPHGLECPC